MADQYRALVTWRHSSWLPADACSNTLYFQNDQSPPTPDYDQLAQDIANAYGVMTWTQGMIIEVRMYNMEDEKPRPERGMYQRAASGSYSTRGAREVALCLSYFGERNLPKQRGRIYLGPFSTATLAERPEAAIMGQLRTLGIALAGIGGENISWRVYSPTDNEYHHIRHIWVGNEWDTMRSRGLKQDARVTADV